MRPLRCWSKRRVTGAERRPFEVGRLGHEVETLIDRHLPHPGTRHVPSARMPCDSGKAASEPIGSPRPYSSSPPNTLPFRLTKCTPAQTKMPHKILATNARELLEKAGQGSMVRQEGSEASRTCSEDASPDLVRKLGRSRRAITAMRFPRAFR